MAQLKLSEIKGSRVKEVHGHISHETGDACFRLSEIVFEDGTTLDCEGEHDHPYLVDYQGDFQAKLEKLDD